MLSMLTITIMNNKMLAVTLIAMIVMAAYCIAESSEDESSEVDTFDAREQLIQDFVDQAFAKRVIHAPHGNAPPHHVSAARAARV